MSATRPLNIVLCWHMHQPDYRDQQNGQFQLPWAYLHSIKDYVDMAAHLETQPLARAVVNFSPILLEQIDDYANRIARYFETKEAIKDPLLDALIAPEFPIDFEFRATLSKSCLQANKVRMIDRFTHYKHLTNIVQLAYKHPHDINYLNDQFLADLLVWYHLVWLGETVRRNDRRIRTLIDKRCGYSLQDRQQVLMIIGELMSGLFDRYKTLSDHGQVELSLSPYAHPMVPLLMDIRCARQVLPDVNLPAEENYPGGMQRCDWHIKRGLEVFERYFERKPQGCWLSEGGVSTEALQLLDAHGFSWTATGAGVLNNSLRSHHRDSKDPKIDSSHRPYTVGHSAVQCFFRDDTLSDLIGFTYCDWHADDAVANLMNALTTLASHPEIGKESVVAIILDGENAWEHYADNGYHFLSALYDNLVAHPLVQLQTFGEFLAKKQGTTQLKALTAGSWVYGSFSTWIGDPQKNRAWDMLVEAKHCYDRVMAEGEMTLEHRKLVDRQLGVCETSDWFWWFGDYNPAATVSSFDGLFRMHLSNLYQLLGVASPAYLRGAFTRGAHYPVHGGVMRKGENKRITDVIEQR